jgi:cyclophilin family peptidyl-prolyl cis-trans isomerase/protein-disulfide isomerase
MSFDQPPTDEQPPVPTNTPEEEQQPPVASDASETEEQAPVSSENPNTRYYAIIAIALIALVVGVYLIYFQPKQQAAAEPTQVPSAVASEAADAAAEQAGDPAAAENAAPTPSIPEAIEDAEGRMVCSVVSSPLKPNPTIEAAFPPITDEDWSEGSKTPKVTFLVYSDLQCPYCSRLDPVLNELVEAHPDDIRVVFRHFPLPMHDKSSLAAQAAEAAGIQGKFLEMKELLFSKTADWTGQTPEEFEPWVKEQAAALGLDTAQFVTDMKSEAVASKVKASLDSSMQIGIPGTPFILINGNPYQGQQDIATFESILKLVEMEDKMYTECPAMEIDQSKQYIATVKTTKGDVVIQLFSDKAPMAVNSFVFLARNGWFNGNIFHRVISGFVAQTGDPSGSGFGGPGYYFQNETPADLKFDKAGVVGMANAGPTTNGSQFFITMQAVPDLDGNYPIFGQVIEGQDVVDKLEQRDSTQGIVPETPDSIISITIEEK